MSFERNKGRLFTHEIDAAIADECRENLKKVGLQDTVTVVTGDALKTMPELEGEIDFVFIDAKKDDYLKYLKVLEPKLKPGALIVADNTIRSAKAMKDFLDYLKESPDYDSVTIRASMEKNDGMTVICRLR
jgi:predicted O-methyltransferase YrrM